MGPDQGLTATSPAKGQGLSVTCITTDKPGVSHMGSTHVNDQRPPTKQVLLNIKECAAVTVSIQNFALSI